MDMIVEEIALYPKGQRTRQSINAYKVIITLKRKINRSTKKEPASAQRSGSLQNKNIVRVQTLSEIWNGKGNWVDIKCENPLHSYIFILLLMPISSPKGPRKREFDLDI